MYSLQLSHTMHSLSTLTNQNKNRDKQNKNVNSNTFKSFILLWSLEVQGFFIHVLAAHQVKNPNSS